MATCVSSPFEHASIKLRPSCVLSDFIMSFKQDFIMAISLRSCAGSDAVQKRACCKHLGHNSRVGAQCPNKHTCHKCTF
eukprot:6474911-Amphidinium_carterae.2